jgi:hypothetical protein
MHHSLVTALFRIQTVSESRSNADPDLKPQGFLRQRKFVRQKPSHESSLTLRKESLQPNRELFKQDILTFFFNWPAWVRISDLEPNPDPEIHLNPGSESETLPIPSRHKYYSTWNNVNRLFPTPLQL